MATTSQKPALTRTDRAAGHGKSAMPLPDPNEVFPVVLPTGERHRGTFFLARVVDHPNIAVGAYTYAHDEAGPEGYAARAAPYLFAGSPERLTIGKFCQIAEGVRFVTGSASHAMTGVSTFPFGAFDPERIAATLADGAVAGGITVGHDCWLGRDALLLPGARLGNGVVLGARTVVGGTVPDYAVVVGNPGRVVRRRFDDRDVERLNRLAWWDRPPAEIEAALAILERGGAAELERHLAR